MGHVQDYGNHNYNLGPKKIQNPKFIFWPFLDQFWTNFNQTKLNFYLLVLQQYDTPRIPSQWKNRSKVWNRNPWVLLFEFVDVVETLLNYFQVRSAHCAFKTEICERVSLIFRSWINSLLCLRLQIAQLCTIFTIYDSPFSFCGFANKY